MVKTCLPGRCTPLATGGLAYWLNEFGYRVTVIEAAAELRKGGTPVDIEGESIDVLTRMGLINAVRATALPPRTLEFKSADDSIIGVVHSQPSGNGAPTEQYEIHRDDLLGALFAPIESSVEVRFGQSITHLENRSDGVAVTSADASQGTYALVSDVTATAPTLLGCPLALPHTLRPPELAFR